MTTSTTTTLSPPVTRPPGGCVTSDGRKIAEGDVVEKVNLMINYLIKLNKLITVN